MCYDFRWIPYPEKVQRRDFQKAMNLKMEPFFGKRALLYFLPFLLLLIPSFFSLHFLSII